MRPRRPHRRTSPLPDPDDLQEALREAGVREDSTVVVYDGGDGLAAARTWWTLRWVGHERTFVLDGGLPAWTASGRSLERGRVEPARGDLTVRPGAVPVLDAEAAAEAAARGELVDVRAPERFRGENEPMDPVAGHIPGAANVAMGPGARYDEHAEAAFYCGSGVTAAKAALAVASGGAAVPPVYIGSWSDWISRGRQVATGRNDEKDRRGRRRCRAARGSRMQRGEPGRAPDEEPVETAANGESPSEDETGPVELNLEDAEGACPYIDSALLDSVTGEEFRFASGAPTTADQEAAEEDESDVPDQATCAVQTGEAAYPDLTLFIIGTEASAEVYEDELADGAEAVDDLGEVAYWIVHAEDTGAGPALEMGWYDDGDIYELRYTTPEGTEPTVVEDLVSGFTELAQSINSAAAEGE
ncbi:hypothetical protein GCM10029992_30690 [Glycomyces albus]